MKNEKLLNEYADEMAHIYGEMIKKTGSMYPSVIDFVCKEKQITIKTSLSYPYSIEQYAYYSNYNNERELIISRKQQILLFFS